MRFVKVVVSQCPHDRRSFTSAKNKPHYSESKSESGILAREGLFSQTCPFLFLFASVCENGVRKAWFAGGSQWTHRLGGSRLSGDPVHLRCSGLAQDSNLVSLSNEVHSLHMACWGRRQGSVHSKTRVKVAAAKDRVAKLEIAAAMERMEGPEVESVRAAHKRALEAVQGVPVDVQVKECESFLVRARSHLAELDSKRVTVLENIEASEKRLLELRAKLQTPPPSEESEVIQLRGLVSQLQAPSRIVAGS